jgi:hypothetical protein
LRRLWRRRADAADSLILLSLGVFLLPPILSPDGYSPHFLRSLGLAAPLGVTIGLGAVELVDLVRRRWARPGAWAAAGLIAATLGIVAAWSGYVYQDRSVADRWEPYSFAIAAAADEARAHPGSAVILDDYSATDVRFLDYHETPAIFEPGRQIAEPQSYSEIVALSRTDIATAVGQALADQATPVVLDPWGRPAVWIVRPSP